MINQITCREGSIPPKALRNLMMEKESASYLNLMVLTLIHSILLRSVSTRGLVKNPLGRHIRRE